MIRSTRGLFPFIGTFLHSTIGRQFGQEKENLEILQQKSYVAQIIMREIANTNRSMKQIQTQSLRDHIINTVNNLKNVDKEPINQMLKLFKEGVAPDQSIFQQSRHQAQILSLNNAVIRFFPTTLISSQVFHHLIVDRSQEFQILTGHSGISKSISVQLYCYLSNIICVYRCRKNIQKYIQKRNYQQIIRKVPKLIYWNVNIRESVAQTRSKILKQFFQIGDDLESTEYLKSAKKTIDPTDFYKKHGIDVILLIDQFNMIVNLQRDLELNKPQNIQQIENKIARGLTLQQNMLYQKYLKKNVIASSQIDNAYESLGAIRLNNFAKTIFQSSVNLQKSAQKDFRIDLGKGTTSKVKYERYRFEDLVSTPMALYQLIDYFMFQLKEKFDIPFYQRNIYDNQSVKKKVRDQLYLKLRSQLNLYYQTPLLISECLRKNIKPKNFQTVNSNQNGNLNEQQFIANSVNDLAKIYKECLKYSQAELQKSVLKFLGKGALQNKIAILAEMYKQTLITKTGITKNNQIKKSLNAQISNKAQEQEKQKLKGGEQSFLAKTYNEQPTYLFQFDATNLVTSLNNQQMKRIGQKKTGDLDVYIDKKLFYYVFQDKKIYSYFKYSDLQSLIRDYHQDVVQFLMSYNEDKIKLLRKDDDKDGRYFENLFIEILSSGKINMNLKEFKINLENIYDKKLGFRAIPQDDKFPKDKDYHFLNNFKYALQNIPSSKHQIFAFVPLSHNRNPEKMLKNNELIQLCDVYQYNPVMDLILLQYSENSSHPIILYAFDFTASGDYKKIRSKYENLMKKLKNFKDSDELTINGQKRKVQLRYFVISPINNQSEIMNWVKQKYGSIFKDSSRKNQLLINESELKQNGYSNLLHSIGHVYMGKDSLQLTKAASSKDMNVNVLWYFDRLAKAVQKLT